MRETKPAEHTCQVDAISGLDSTRVWAHSEQLSLAFNIPWLDPKRVICTFGAVVFILKATGVAFSFVMVKVVVVGWMNGPNRK